MLMFSYKFLLYEITYRCLLAMEEILQSSHYWLLKNVCVSHDIGRDRRSPETLRQPISSTFE
jgi:hypothetical protein